MSPLFVVSGPAQQRKEIKDDWKRGAGLSLGHGSTPDMQQRRVINSETKRQPFFQSRKDQLRRNRCRDGQKAKGRGARPVGCAERKAHHVSGRRSTKKEKKESREACSLKRLLCTFLTRDGTLLCCSAVPPCPLPPTSQRNHAHRRSSSSASMGTYQGGSRSACLGFSR